MEQPFFQTYSDILRTEIVTASGCTEPISVAYCAAKAREVLGMQPTSVTVSVSADLLKNVKGVVIPNTNGLKGIRAAVAAGIVCCDAKKGMQVIADVSPEQQTSISYFMDNVRIDILNAETDCPFYISITLYARTSYSRVVIANSHSNIVEIMKNGEAILKRPIVLQNEDNSIDMSCLHFHDIIAYADSVDLSKIKDLLDLQISCNVAICEAGLNQNFAYSVGRILLETASDERSEACAFTAAGIDAHMGGCELPVAILCGSGSVGIATSVPILCYAKKYGTDTERMYRALIVSDLLTVYQKTNANRSRFCSVGFAGCAVSAAIAYLLGGDEASIAQAFYQAVSIRSDTVCDGAKPSCAAKVASAVEAGILGYQLALRQNETQNPVPDIDDLIRDRQ